MRKCDPRSGLSFAHHPPFVSVSSLILTNRQTNKSLILDVLSADEGFFGDEKAARAPRTARAAGAGV
jgi:hypothetical protein